MLFSPVHDQEVEVGRKNSQNKLSTTLYTMVLSTRANIEAADWLLTQHNFTYVLPGVFADAALEKLFGKPDNAMGVISTLTLYLFFILFIFIAIFILLTRRKATEALYIG